MGHVGISVADQARSRAFYERYFGFGQRPARVRGDGVLILYGCDGLALALGPPAGSQRQPPVAHLGVRLADRGAVAQLHARLAADGVPILERREQGDYASVSCADPDGHIVEGFWEPPAADWPPVEQPLFRLDAHRSLRALRESDAPALHALVVANRAHLAPWMPWAASQGPDGTLEFLRSAERQAAARQELHLAILVEEAIVGVVGFHRIDWEHRHASIGYWIAAEAQGQGTVTIAVRALCDHAFDSWQLHRVEIRAAVDNHRSRAIPTRLGFLQEGVLRQVERVGGRYLDHVVYGMLAEDWPRAGSRG